MPIARSTPAQKPRGLARRTSMDRRCGSTGVILPFPLPPSFPPPPEQSVQDQGRGAEGDRGVGEVELREVPAACVQQDEVDDVPERDAVPEVADRAAENEREAGAEEPL